MDPSLNQINTDNSLQSTLQNNISCIFCQKLSQHQSYGPMIARALYQKYSSSQNYYFTKDFNQIFNNERIQKVINYHDQVIMDEDEEFLKRFYLHSEYQKKLSLLAEYYKYHRDIPRLFMKPSFRAVFKYHEKIRRIDYYKITKLMDQENQQPQQSNLLKHQDNKQMEKDLSNKILSNLESLLNNDTLKESQKASKRQIKQKSKISQKESVSNTFQEINQKLNEILSAHKGEVSYFTNNESETQYNLFLSDLEKQLPISTNKNSNQKAQELEKKEKPKPVQKLQKKQSPIKKAPVLSPRNDKVLLKSLAVALTESQKTFLSNELTKLMIKKPITSCCNQSNQATFKKQPQRKPRTMQASPQGVTSQRQSHSNSSKRPAKSKCTTSRPQSSSTENTKEAHQGSTIAFQGNHFQKHLEGFIKCQILQQSQQPKNTNHHTERVRNIGLAIPCSYLNSQQIK